jgi:type I restriction enzyme S subunit
VSELPSGWAETTIGEILQFNYGKGLPERNRSGSGFPVYGSNGVVGYHEKAFISAESLVVGRKGSVGEVHHSRGPCWPIDTTYFVDEFFGMPARFWYYVLKGLDLAGLNRATAIPGLNREDAYQVNVVLPPQTEQKRIADKLDAISSRVDACRDRLDRVPAILKRFRQAILAAATSGILTEEWRNEHGDDPWVSTTLGVCGTVSGGLTKNAHRQSHDLKKRYLRVANVYANRLDLSDVAEIGLTQAEHAKTRLRSGDLLIVEGNGSLDQIGRVALWSGELDDCVHQNHLIRWRSSGPASKFVLFWLLSPEGRSDLMRLASTTTGLHTLSISKISALAIQLPPPQEQHEIIRRVEALFAYADRLEVRYTAARAQVERLTPALLAKAFRGELVPQDPNDEPASMLLERIRAARAASERAASPKRRKGGSRPKTSQKAEVLMLTRKDVQDMHLTTILKERGPLTAEALWSASQLDIDDFYDQLKGEEARGLLREKRGDSSNAPRMLEAA